MDIAGIKSVPSINQFLANNYIFRSRFLGIFTYDVLLVVIGASGQFCSKFFFRIRYSIPKEENKEYKIKKEIIL